LSRHTDEDVDRAIATALAEAGAPPRLPVGFHARLEERLQHEAARRRWRLGRRLLGVYWALAFAASLAVLSTLPTASQGSGTPATQIALFGVLALFACPALLLRHRIWPELVVDAIEFLRLR
jgi:hypothetical protein